MFAGASLDENSGAFCELKANFFRLILTKAELLALTAADFDFEKETVRINKSYQRLHGEDVITTPKTKKSNRIIKMPKFLCEEMQEYLQMLYGLKKKDRIFTVTKSYLHHEMDRGAKAAGVKHIRIHDLWYSHISLLIANPIDGTSTYGVIRQWIRMPNFRSADALDGSIYSVKNRIYIQK